MPETTTFQYDDYNKLTEITFPDSTTETLSYDDNGQLVRREKSTGETTEYEWNDQGMLVKVILPNGEPVEYEYDGNQRLISRKSSDGVDNFVQSGWDIITKTDDVGKRTYYTGSSAVESEESAKYFHYNHRGDTVLVTDSEGNTLNNFSYEAYGKVTNSEGIPVNSLTVKDIPNLFVGASGIRYDTKTNLHYMRFRWFSVSQLRFISPDLLMDLNRYAYVSGNPVSFIDPLGLYFVYRADNQEEADAINYMISLSYTYGSPEIQYMINKLEESGIPIVIDFEWGMNNKMETQWDRNGKYLTISINKNIYCNPTLADKQITDISGTFVQEVYHLWLDILRKEKPGLIPDDEKVMGTEETYAHLIEGFFYVNKACIQS